jgi:Na+/phosphate symporter
MVVVCRLLALIDGADNAGLTSPASALQLLLGADVGTDSDEQLI